MSEVILIRSSGGVHTNRTILIPDSDRDQTDRSSRSDPSQRRSSSQSYPDPGREQDAPFDPWVD